MIENVVFYDPKTGVVLASGKTTSPALVCPAGASILFEAEACPGKDMVLDGVVVPRPPLQSTLVGNKLIGVPAGASLEIEGVSYIADGSPIELEFSLPGKYTIRVHAPPYLDTEVLYEN
ncbi:MAG: hypothetical protein E2594_17270 [Pseudomonas sp.]|nr:hypothetical protein [Pseudomonas sp.]